jgi:hypothetical protein
MSYQLTKFSYFIQSYTSYTAEQNDETNRNFIVYIAHLVNKNVIYI